MISLPPIGCAISFSEAAKSSLLLKPLHPSSLHRWRTKGLRGIKLESWLIAGRRVTTTDALREFLEKASRPDSGSLARANIDNAANSRARAQLASMGIATQRKTRLRPNHRHA